MIVRPRAAADLAAVVAGQGAVDGGRMGVVDAVMGGADEGAAVHLLRQARQVFRQLQSGDAGGDRLELAADLGGRLRLHVPHVEMTGTAVEEKENTVVGARGGAGRLFAGSEQARQGQPQHAGRACLQHMTPRQAHWAGTRRAMGTIRHVSAPRMTDAADFHHRG